ncbi:hypothetical protein NQZ68_017614 [Dissostichus eleginoides]|nr:hypothetical protein NQZ68_017614 [Dissostichus eleginoides]
MANMRGNTFNPDEESVVHQNRQQADAFKWMVVEGRGRVEITLLSRLCMVAMESVGGFHGNPQPWKPTIFVQMR